MDDFETQMDKGVLLGKLHRQLEVLRMERAKARGEYQRAITAYRKKLAVSIRAGLKRLESGKIDVTSCQYDLLHELIKQAGDQPDDTRTLDKQIAGYEAAIYQITNSRSDKMRVTTSQIKTLLGGGEVTRRR